MPDGMPDGAAVVGLLLDVDQGSLAVYLNGARCGLAVPSGLQPPLQWGADLYEGDTVRVVGPKPPPKVAVEVRAAEEGTWAEPGWREVLGQR